MLRVDERSGEDLGLSPGPKLNVQVLNSFAVNKMLCIYLYKLIRKFIKILQYDMLKQNTTLIALLSCLLNISKYISLMTARSLSARVTIISVIGPSSVPLPWENS